ncbi:MAG: hypothetical protein HY273_10030 [Gammaproteobacteria bacterium]|nr:hypothetical protein [Gammaproteobacteria bacterium]
MSNKREQEITRRMLIIHAFEAAGRIGHSAFKYGAMMFIAAQFAPVFIAYADTTSIHEFTVNSAIDWAINDHLAALLGLVFGVGGIYYGRQERKLNKDTIERLSPYQAQYEREHDPKRSSSGLTPRGDTRPEDQHE